MMILSAAISRQIPVYKVLSIGWPYSCIDIPYYCCKYTTVKPEMLSSGLKKLDKISGGKTLLQ